MVLWGCLLSILWGCGSPEKEAIPYSLTRIGSYKTVLEGDDREIKIFNGRTDCLDLIGNLNLNRPEDQKMSVEYEQKEIVNCMPWIDRKNGEVQLSFALMRGDSPEPIPLTEKYVDVVHDQHDVKKDASAKVTLKRHEKILGSQLYMLIIDGSGSMDNLTGVVKNNRELTRMDFVKRALLNPSVVEAFFPDGSNNQIVMYTFTDGTPVRLGKMISSKREYKGIVRQLRSLGGYTHLYDAIEFGMNQLEESRDIEEFLAFQSASPTMLVLTDGFNNESRGDRCSSNAKRLEKLIQKIDTKRTNKESNLLVLPRIYTVGLGKKIREKVLFRENYQSNVDVDILCGQFKSMTIDGKLEKLGIDNVSLEWIAKVGGGQSFVSQSESGLAKAFRAVAETRFKWFEIRYKVSPMWMRKAFKTRIQIRSMASVSSEIDIYPHAWLDGPNGKLQKEGWSNPRQPYHASIIFSNIVGIMIFFSILGAAIFNIRRVLVGRLQPPK